MTKVSRTVENISNGVKITMTTTDPEILQRMLNKETRFENKDFKKGQCNAMKQGKMQGKEKKNFEKISE